VPSKAKQNQNNHKHYKNLEPFNNNKESKVSDNEASQNLSKNYKYETIDSGGNSKLKRSNLQKIELSKYKHDSEVTAISTFFAPDVNNQFVNSSDKKGIEINNNFNKRKRKDFSIDLNTKNNSNNNKININNSKIVNNPNLSSEPLLKTPIRQCIDNWKGIGANKSSNKLNLNLYRTSFFNIPLISMINNEKKDDW